MGTSTSQPSPTKKSEGGKQWNEVKQTIESDGNPNEIVNAVMRAYEAQYGSSEEILSILSDRGIKTVERVLSEKISAQSQEFSSVILAASILSEIRSALVAEKSSTFFSELATGSAVKAIGESKGNLTGTMEKFRVNFATSIMDYVISRDLPQTFGSSGITSTPAILTKISELKIHLSAIHSRHNPETVEQFWSVLINSNLPRTTR